MILLVRHGRTASNASGLLLGRSDPSLDDVGRTQVAALAGAIGSVDRVISSPLQRCRLTASALAGDVEVEVDDRVIEVDYGDWEGRPVAEVSTGEWQRWRSDLSWSPPGGESLVALGYRVRAAMVEFARDQRAEVGTTVVVTHVSPIKAGLAWALGVGDEIAWRSFVAPASITEIAVASGHPTLRRFNVTVGEISG